MLKKEVFQRRRQWALALEEIAREVGKDSQLYKILGTMAWSRYDGEPTAPDSKDNAIFGLGFLQGARYVALNVARLYDLEGEPSLAGIHERIGAK